MNGCTCSACRLGRAPDAQKILATQPELWSVRLWHLAGSKPEQIADGPGYHVYHSYGLDCVFSGDHHPRHARERDPDWVTDWFDERRAALKGAWT